MTISYFAGGIAILVLILYIFQRHLIYYPRSYDFTYDLQDFENVVELDYQIAEGNQVSFYLPPRKKTILFQRNFGWSLEAMQHWHWIFMILHMVILTKRPGFCWSNILVTEKVREKPLLRQF